MKNLKLLAVAAVTAFAVMAVTLTPTSTVIELAICAKMALDPVGCALRRVGLATIPEED